MGARIYTLSDRQALKSCEPKLTWDYKRSIKQVAEKNQVTMIRVGCPIESKEMRKQTAGLENRPKDELQ